jgi:DNA-binding MarR family transcriptional regulator
MKPNRNPSLSPSSPAPAGAASPPSDPDMAIQLRTVLHRLVKVLRKQTRNEALLSLTERSTLGLLYPDKQLSPSEIAQVEKVTTQSISQVINHLAELNYIDKNPSEEDKRKTLLSLTPVGKGYIEQARLQKQEWLAQAFAEKLDTKEKEVLQQAIQILSKLLDE